MFAQLVVVHAICACSYAVLGVHIPKATALKRESLGLKGKKVAAKARFAASNSAPLAHTAPAARAAALAATDRNSNATLTPEQSAALDKAACCGEDVNSSMSEVLGAVAVVNATALGFLDSVTSALGTAEETLWSLQNTFSSVLKIAGIDGGFLSDLVYQMTSKISDTLVVVNATNEDLKKSFANLIDGYSSKADDINESLSTAIASAREGLLASAEKSEEEAAANQTFLVARHLSIMMGPKSTATQAIAKVNSTADTLTEMLTKLNTTLLDTLMVDVIEKINSSALKLQDALIAGEEKFPGNVPSALTDKVDSIFDLVFDALDAVKPSEVNSELTSKIEAASTDVASLETCIAPLNAMVEDMDGAWHPVCSWSTLSVLISISLHLVRLQ